MLRREYQVMKKKQTVAKKGKVENKEKILTFLTMSANLPVAALKIIHQPGMNDDGLSQNITHGHDFYELIVVIRGSGIHTINGVESEMHPGMVALLRPYKDYHDYKFSSELVLLNFMFTPEVLSPWEKYLKLCPGYNDLFGSTLSNDLYLNSAQVAELNILQDAIGKENITPSSGSELFITIKLLDALLIIIRNIHNPSDTRYISSMLSPATSYMMQNFQENFSIKKLAKLTNLSESSFFRKFKNEFHESPYQWILKYRIRKAMEFLLRSDMQIQDIALATGFKDPFYFSRKFRSIAGCSPQKYRKKNHGRVNIIFGSEKLIAHDDFMMINDDGYMQKK